MSIRQHATLPCISLCLMNHLDILTKHLSSNTPLVITGCCSCLLYSPNGSSNSGFLDNKAFRTRVHSALGQAAHGLSASVVYVQTPLQNKQNYTLPKKKPCALVSLHSTSQLPAHYSLVSLSNIDRVNCCHHASSIAQPSVKPEIRPSANNLHETVFDRLTSTIDIFASRYFPLVSHVTDLPWEIHAKKPAIFVAGILSRTHCCILSVTHQAIMATSRSLVIRLQCFALV